VNWLSLHVAGDTFFSTTLAGAGRRVGFFVRFRSWKFDAATIHTEHDPAVNLPAVGEALLHSLSHGSLNDQGQLWRPSSQQFDESLIALGQLLLLWIKKLDYLAYRLKSLD